MKAIGVVFAMIGVVTVIVGLGWLTQGNQFLLFQFFAPKYEQVRRETFEQSKAYNQGMIQELQNMQFQWEQADDAHKDALASLILHRAADYDQNQLPPDLRQFISGLRNKNQFTK